MVQTQAEVQERYQAALEALVEKLEQDYYTLAAVVYGSLARGEAWEKSDIDLIIVQRDKLGREFWHCWLTEDGINISAEIVSRSRLKRILEGATQGSIWHSVQSHGRLLFSKDASISAWFEETGRVGTRDQAVQLLQEMIEVPWMLDKAEKWLYVKHDLRYSFLWLLYVANRLARVEVILNGQAPSREALQQALRYNPAFFQAVYTDLIDGPKDEQAIRNAMDAVDTYLEARAGRLFQPILDYLAEADGLRSASELDAHLREKGLHGTPLGLYEWLARKGIIVKAAAPIRLTEKSQVTLEEPAYYYDGDY